MVRITVEEQKVVKSKNLFYAGNTKVYLSLHFCKMYSIRIVVMVHLHNRKKTVLFYLTDNKKDGEKSGNTYVHTQDEHMYVYGWENFLVYM